MTTTLRRLAIRTLGAVAFAGALAGLGLILVADAHAGDVPDGAKTKVAAVEKSSKEADGPKTQAGKKAAAAPLKKKKRVDFGRYEGY